ncbi:MAG: branched-chain amino acid ABC transporter permease [Pseudonocardiaceae bacterium]|nr:branched-chain amino acid ABC transporter permease [Pseudonocardiaceae bacterium]
MTHLPWFSTRRLLGGLIAVVAALLLLGLPGLVNSYQLFLACLVMTMATAGLGLVLIMGWSGQIVLAQAGFMGVGAYGTTSLVALGLPWPLAVLLAGLVAALIGVAIGLPATRLRGFYLAIATLAFAELMLRIFIEAEPITGGIAGLVVTPVVLGNLDVGGSRWYLCLGLAAVTALAVWRIGRSGLGRRLRAVRDADVAVGSLAISATRAKLLAFALSAFIGALAGAAYAQVLTYLTPHIFGLTLLIELLIVAFLGGVSYVGGPFLGAVVVIGLRELLQDIGSWQRLAFGLVLALVVGFLPRGLASLRSRIGAARRRRADTSTATPQARDVTAGVAS